MDLFTAMRVFRAVAEKGGFSAGARQLGMSKASVSKQVSALEDHLGARLFNRTTRRLSLTEVGQGYLDRVVGILDDVAETESAVGLRHANPCGTLRVNAPMSFAILHLAPALCGFMGRYPSLTVDLTLNDRRVDLIEEGVDVAVRIGHLADSSLIARRLAPCRFALCASPAYVAAHGAPRTMADLADHPCGIYTLAERPHEWRLIAPDGKPVSVAVTGRLQSNNGHVIRDAVIAGHMIGAFPTFMIGAELRSGKLVRLLPDHGTEDAGIYAVYPPGRHLSAKVRVFVDYLAERFGGEPPWDHPAG